MVGAMVIPGMGATLKIAHKIKTLARATTLVILANILNQKNEKANKEANA